MKKLNCWEYMECGREPRGKNAEQLGVCPVTQPSNYNSTNKGKYTGRFCWVVAGTFCKGIPSGEYAEKLLDCLKCKFLKKVNEEENRDFKLSPD